MCFRWKQSRQLSWQLVTVWWQTMAMGIYWGEGGCFLNLQIDVMQNISNDFCSNCCTSGHEPILLSWWDQLLSATVAWVHTVKLAQSKHPMLRIGLVQLFFCKVNGETAGTTCRWFVACQALHYTFPQIPAKATFSAGNQLLLAFNIISRRFPQTYWNQCGHFCVYLEWTLCSRPQFSTCTSDGHLLD